MERVRTSWSWARTAADAFESHAGVMAAYNKLRISPGQLAPASAGWGIQSLGTYRGIPLYVYEAEYRDSAGSMQPFVPLDNVLVAASSLGGRWPMPGWPSGRGRKHTQGLRGRRVPVVALEALEDFRKFRLSSRPVPVPQNLAAGQLLDVL